MAFSNSNSNSNREIKSLFRKIEHQILDSEKYSNEHILIQILICMYLNNEIAIDELKKSSFLKTKNVSMSRFSYIFEGVINHSKILYLSKKNIQLFESLINLSSLWFNFIALEKEINTKIKGIKISNKEGSFVTTVLAFADYIFAKREIISINENDIIYPEEISSSASVLLNKYKDINGFKEEKNRNKIDETLISDNIIKELLIKITILERIDEMGKKILFLGYLCIKDKNNIKILPFDDEFDKALTYGYISYNSQKYIHSLAFVTEKQDEILSFDKICDIINKDTIVNIVTREDSEYCRYSLELNKILIDKLKEYINVDALYIEEAAYLSSTARNFVVHESDLLNKQIIEGFTVNNLLKFQRITKFYFFLFINTLITKHDNSLGNYLKILRSIIIPFVDNDYSYLSVFFTDEQIQKYLKVVSIDITKKFIVDLQYTPTLKIDRIHYNPLTIIANSDIIRNLYVSQRYNKNELFNDSGLVDNVSETIFKRFKELGFNGEIGYNFVFEKQSSDVDLLVYKDDIIFIFEVKNTISPTSIYELRTSIDCLNKATAQLDLSTKAFSSVDFIKNYNIGKTEKINTPKKIVSSVIFTNRLFCGYKHENYEIINYFELMNMITHATVVKSGVISTIRDTITLTSENLIDILSGKYALTKQQLLSMKEFNINYKLGEYSIEAKNHRMQDYT